MPSAVAGHGWRLLRLVLFPQLVSFFGRDPTACLVNARRSHDENNHKHAHTYLQFCANPTTATSHACIHKVSAKWPAAAVLDPQECKKAAPPYAAVDSTCVPGASLGSFNVYDPITIPTGLLHPNEDFRRGSDVDKLSDWDRIRCRDGHLFATGWYRKYTPMECARLCSKIHNFYGKSCTHFSRQWIHSKIPEHSDLCGRDGETLEASMPAHGAWGSAGTGTGAYTYRGQCVFFSSANNECCATKAAWREEGTNLDSNYCEAKYAGGRKDSWDSKHRSWRLLSSGYTATEAWPVTSLGRRLSDERRRLYSSSGARRRMRGGTAAAPGAANTTTPTGRRGDDSHDDDDIDEGEGEGDGAHELFLPNGTRFWAYEEERMQPQ